MTLIGASIVFFLAWWMVFLGSLPIGVRGQFEDGEVTDGTEPGAPVTPDLQKKAVWATIGAFIILTITWLVMALGLIQFGAN